MKKNERDGCTQKWKKRDKPINLERPTSHFKGNLKIVFRHVDNSEYKDIQCNPTNIRKMAHRK